MACQHRLKGLQAVGSNAIANAAIERTTIAPLPTVATFRARKTDCSDHVRGAEAPRRDAMGLSGSQAISLSPVAITAIACIASPH